MKIEGEIYPLTIIADRYCGLYSGAKFLAFNCFPNELPEGFDSDDNTECSEFWTNNKEPIGLGCTPNEAYHDLNEIISKRLADKEIIDRIKSDIQNMNKDARKELLDYLQEHV